MIEQIAAGWRGALIRMQNKRGGFQIVRPAAFVFDAEGGFQWVEPSFFDVNGAATPSQHYIEATITIADEGDPFVFAFDGPEWAGTIESYSEQTDSAAEALDWLEDYYADNGVDRRVAREQVKASI